MKTRGRSSSGPFDVLLLGGDDRPAIAKLLRQKEQLLALDRSRVRTSAPKVTSTSARGGCIGPAPPLRCSPGSRESPARAAPRRRMRGSEGRLRREVCSPVALNASYVSRIERRSGSVVLGLPTLIIGAELEVLGLCEFPDPLVVPERQPFLERTDLLAGGGPLESKLGRRTWCCGACSGTPRKAEPRSADQ